MAKGFVKNDLIQKAKKNPRFRLWSSAYQRSKQKGIPFNIEPEDIYIPETCPYLGIKLTTELGKGYRPNTATVDRIEPQKGYVKGNIQVISRQANMMKSHATPDELFNFALAVLKLI